MSSEAINPGPADLTDAPDHSARNRIVILILLISTFTMILNETIMSVALPRMMVDLNVTANAAQWLTTAFLLTMATVIPITGFLLQRFHTRTVFIAALTFFSSGTLLCALSPSLWPLVAGRVVQACGTAMMMPLMMTTVMNLVPPDSRGKTMGNISIVISVAPAIGPTISGIILNLLDWRWMFWLVLPIGLACLATGLMWLKNVTEPRKVPLDVISVPLAAIGFGGLVYGLSTIGEGHGEPSSVPLWLPLAVGAVVLVAFVLRQIALGPKERALLDLRTFKVKVFSVAVVMMGLSMMALFGMIILLPIYMQNVLGMEPLQSGLMLLPGGLLMGLLAPIVGRLFDAHGARKLVIPGSVAVSGALWLMTTYTPETTVPVVLGGHILLSAGLAFLFTPLFTSSLGSLPQHLYSHGSAVIGTIQQVAGAAGIALFVSVMTVRTATGIENGLDQAHALSEGLSAGFLCGAIASLGLIAASFFVRRPPDMKDGPAPMGH